MGYIPALKPHQQDHNAGGDDALDVQDLAGFDQPSRKVLRGDGSFGRTAREFFKVEPLSTPGDGVDVSAGFAFSPARKIMIQSATQSLTTFTVVGVGNVRWDLIYIDQDGVAAVLEGNEVAGASPDFTEAPGNTSGPDLPDNIVPLAYVKIDEDTTVVISETDITDISGVLEASKTIRLYFVDKGLLGAAPTGASDVVTALFAGESAGGSATKRAVVTSPPENYVHLLDQNKDELVHTATGSRVYGRLTVDDPNNPTVWTLSYFYTNASGVETAITTIETECTVVPSDLSLIGVPKTFSDSDPSRPLSMSPFVQLSDQIAGTIPTASETVEGKVELATNTETDAGKALQANDSRLPTQNENDALQGAATGGAPSNANRYVVDDDTRLAAAASSDYIDKADAMQSYQGNGTVTTTGTNVHDNYDWTELVSEEDHHSSQSAIISSMSAEGVFTFNRPASGYKYFIDIVAWSGTNEGAGSPSLTMELHEDDNVTVIRKARFNHGASGAGGFTNAQVLVKKTIVVDALSSPIAFELWHAGNAPTTDRTFLEFTRRARVA